MKIALLGFGVVGRGVYDLTKDREDISVSKVLCLEDVTLPDAEVTRNFRDIVEDETIDTVVECMGGLHPAFDFVKETLGDAVKEVKASARLKSHPVCLTAGEGLSFEMEKYFQSVQPDSGIKADRILELNVEHPAFQALETAVTADPEKAKKYAKLLYNQALLIAGLPLEDPSGYTDLVCELMK